MLAEEMGLFDNLHPDHAWRWQQPARHNKNHDQRLPSDDEADHRRDRGRTAPQTFHNIVHSEPSRLRNCRHDAMNSPLSRICRERVRGGEFFTTAAIRPGRGVMTTMRSDKYTASVMLWVTNTTVFCCFSQMCKSSIDML